jgi:hypothetical protein
LFVRRGITPSSSRDGASGLTGATQFRDVETDAQLVLAKQIVNKYPVYGKNENYLGDLEVITLAGALGITVISIETPQPQTGQKRPKIPNVCAEFQVSCVSVAGLLRELKRSGETSAAS